MTLRPAAALALLLGAACTGAAGTRAPEPVARTAPPDGPRLGVNFLRFRAAPGVASPHPQHDAVDPPALFASLRADGAAAMRQLTEGDVHWRGIEPRDDAFEWRTADAVLLDAPVVPIVTLFGLQYASSTPPWAGADTPFQPGLSAEAREYVTAVVGRYRDHVRYWEIGNEMDHWKAALRPPPGRANPAGVDKLPPNTPAGGFPPEQQGRFVAEVARLVRELDPDAVIVLPGMSSPHRGLLDEWLVPFVAGSGADAFDVVNYHYYGPWQSQLDQRAGLADTLTRLGLADKPVWLTETGTTADPTNTRYTDYPNSPEEQAADVVRRVVQAWAAGDALVLWHSYYDSPGGPGNEWRAFGLRRRDGAAKPSVGAFRFVAAELAGHTRVTTEQATADRRVFRLDFADGATRWVAWGSGDWTLPDGVTRTTPAVFAGEAPPWTEARAGERVPLSSIPRVAAGG